jgi:hypothetical protein
MTEAVVRNKEGPWQGGRSGLASARGSIPDTEPQVTARLRSLQAAAPRGEAKKDDFAYVRAGFFPDWAQCETAAV